MVGSDVDLWERTGRNGRWTKFTFKRIHLFVWWREFLMCWVLLFFFPLWRTYLVLTLSLIFRGSTFYINFRTVENTKFFFLEAFGKHVGGNLTSFCTLIWWQLVLNLSSIFSLIFSLNIEVSCSKIKAVCLKTPSVFMFRALSFLFVVIAFQRGLVLKEAIKIKNHYFAVRAQTTVFVLCKSSLMSSHTM